jgi:V/A-type H+/Na+-transporting ATPase subunit E
MEELQSTDNLDKEILEDARKKAHKILKAADDTIKSKTTEWEKKLTVTLGELEEKYAKNSKSITEEIMAVLPIDKQRARARKIEELLNSAVENWYVRLNRKRILDFLQMELSKRLTSCGGFSVSDDVNAYIHKVEKSEAEAIIKAVLPGKACNIEKTQSTAAYPQIILENKDVRIYASIGKAVEFILGEKREELIAALLGDALNSGAPDGANALGEGALC